MSVEFITAKNGELTAKNNGIFLHSAYSPEKEAERFVQNIVFPFKTDSVIILEPSLSYCVKYFKQKNPEYKIFAVRFCNDFSEYDSQFTKVFSNLTTLDSDLLNYFGEESLFSVFFVSWITAEKAFNNEYLIAGNKIKTALENAKTLLVTRQFFEKKWFLNSINFIKYSNNFLNLNKIDFPILIIASGPSLKDSLEIIKKNQNKFFIIGLSSAISVLIKNEIIPDLCLSTDGGYWANEHLKPLKNKTFPLGLSIEAFVSKKFLHEKQIVPFMYSDGISNEIAKKSDLKFQLIERNGTVSGTALKLAQKLTDESLYFCGLDLSENKGFQHTQPNILEINNSIKDFKINNLEKRSARSSLKNSSLEIYKNWFSNEKTGSNKVFRIINENHKQNILGQIKDISTTEFSKITENIDSDKKNHNFYTQINCKNQNFDELKSFILNNLNCEKWQKQLFPLDFVALNHDSDNSAQKEKLEKQISKLKKKIQEIL